VAELCESRQATSSELQSKFASLEEDRTRFFADCSSQIKRLAAQVEESMELDEAARRQVDDIGEELQQIIRLIRKPGR
jgi:molecular chaperone DnaK (HSP70)